MRSNRGSSEKLIQQNHAAVCLPEETAQSSPFKRGLSIKHRSQLQSFVLYHRPSAQPLNRKRPSPVETLLHSLAPNSVTWGYNDYGPSLKVPEDMVISGRSSYSEDEALLDEGKNSARYEHQR